MASVMPTHGFRFSLILSWLLLQGRRFRCEPLHERFQARRPDVPPEVDCAMRDLVLDFAGVLLNSTYPPGATSAIADALQMHRFCGRVQEPLPPSSQPSAMSPGAPCDLGAVPPGAPTWVVAPSGSDSAPGTFAEPFASISHALAVSRSARQAGVPAIIVLRAGTYYLNGSPIELGAQDSGLLLTACLNEVPTLSGGVDLHPKWQKHLGHILMAPNIGHTFDGLFFMPTSTDANNRLVRARHPNSNPEYHLWPENNTYIEPEHVFYPSDWMDPPKWQQIAPTVIRIDTPNWNTDGGLPPNTNFTTAGGMSPYYEARVGGPMRRFVGNIAPGPLRTSCLKSAGGAPYPAGCAVPGGVWYKDSAFLGAIAPRHWANPSTAIVHAIHSLGQIPAIPWFNWQWHVASILVHNKSALQASPHQPAADGIVFGEGGWQQVQGFPGGSNFFVENVMELLDAPGEWYHDRQAQILYYWPNSTNASDALDGTFVGTDLESVVRIVGSRSSPVHNVTIRGLRIRHTSADYLEPYEAPGGGDQSVHRGAAIVVEGAEGVHIQSCSFDRIDGSGVIFSRYTRHCTVSKSEFSFVGSAAVVVMGEAKLIDGTDGNFPRHTVLEKNWIHDGGVWSKNYLGGAIFLALQSESVLSENVIYNTPRSCITFNDNFGGGDKMLRNLLFNCNRETSDTGNVYTYNRLPFLTTIRNGSPSLIAATRIMDQNLFLCSYGSLWGIDHDDGSSWYRDTRNVNLYSGSKSSTFATGGHSKSITNSLFVLPSLYGADSCTFGGGYDEVWSNNTCIINIGLDIGIPNGYKVYTQVACDPAHPVSTLSNPVATPTRKDNRFLVNNISSFFIQCGDTKWNLTEAQQHGMDLGSVLQPMEIHPKELAAQVVQLAWELLSLRSSEQDRPVWI